MKRKSKALLIGLAFLLVASASVAHVEPKHVKIATRACPYDSAWKIADRLQDQYKDPRDIREIVYYIVKENKLADGGLIQPGQVLIVDIVDNRN